MQSCTVDQGALTGPLDDRTIGQRIAERDPQLEHVRTGVDSRQGNVARGRQIRISDREVNDQAGLQPRLAVEINRHASHPPAATRAP